MLGIVTVNYGAPDLIKRYAVPRKLPSGRMRFFVVDNFTSTHNADAVSALASEHRWTAVPLPDNGGFSRGCNAGAQAAIEAGATMLVFVNPDVDISVAVLEALAEHLEANPKSLVSPALVEPARAKPFLGAATKLSDGQTTAADSPDSFNWLSGAALAMTVQTFQDLGGFDEDYFMYWEDLDLCYRAGKAGYDLDVLTEVTATHDVGATQGTEHKSPLYLHYNCRNRLVFARKNLPGLTRAAWRKSARRYATEAILRSGSKKYLAHKPSVQAAWKGTREGLAWREGMGQQRDLFDVSPAPRSV